MNHSSSFNSDQTNKNLDNIDKMFQLEGPPDSTVTIGGKDYLYFAGDDYLSFQTNPEILSSACEAVLRYGISSAPSQSKYIPSPIHDVEQKAAELYQTDKAIYCSSNEKAFEILIESIQYSFDKVFIDECCQSSFLKVFHQQTIRSPKSIILFKHNDPDHLNELLIKYLQPNERPLIIIEGIFPFTGKIAPVDQYVNLLKNYDDSSLLIDDSHSLGVLGKNGCGILEHFGFQTNNINQSSEDFAQDNLFDTDFHLLNQSSFNETENIEDFQRNRFQNESEISLNLFNKNRFIDSSDKRIIQEKSLPVKTYLIASLTKAIGGFGGIIPGSETFVERLRETLFQHNDSVPPTPIAAATAKGLHLSFHNKNIRQKLQKNTQYLKSQMQRLGFSVENNLAPILVLNLGTNQNMRRIHQYLFDNNIIVSFVPNQKYQGAKGVLRTTLLATHDLKMLDALIHIFCEAIK